MTENKRRRQVSLIGRRMLLIPLTRPMAPGRRSPGSDFFDLILALSIFSVRFPRMRAGLDGARLFVSSALVVGLVCLAKGRLGRDVPPGLLQDFGNLPWPSPLKRRAMSQTALPFLFMRGGTSRGPYFRLGDLPEDRATLSELLIAVIGAGNARNIDGLGGGHAVTTKVAILSPSEDPKADVDYLFAQVAVGERLVDYGPTCGNILVGVGPAAIEMGLVPVVGDETPVRIRAVNTGALVEAVVQTPKGAVRYDGDVTINGVPGKAAPVALKFLDVVGSRTGAMLPTGKLREDIDGTPVTCIDVAMPMMIGRAADFAISGHESQAELDDNQALFARMEALRLEAGRRMGLGDVATSVMPKIGLVAEPRAGGHLTARYFMPWATHPTMAVTGSQCLAACALLPGSVADGLVRAIAPSPTVVRIEHPMGEMAVTVAYERGGDDGLHFRSAGVVRTARLIARGEVMVPAGIVSDERERHLER